MPPGRHFFWCAWSFPTERQPPGPKALRVEEAVPRAKLLGLRAKRPAYGWRGNGVGVGLEKGPPQVEANAKTLGSQPHSSTTVDTGGSGALSTHSVVTASPLQLPLQLAATGPKNEAGGPITAFMSTRRVLQATVKV